VTPEQLSQEVLSAARDVFAARGWDPSSLPATTAVERPRNRGHGDYASNLALQLARRVGMPPRELAAALADRLGRSAGVKSVEVAGPGFLNIWLEAAAAGELARVVVQEGDGYGRSAALAGQRINLEFVSANPTGPVHLGHTRWAAVGDALRRILAAAGAAVAAEHYINDAGTQLEQFGASVLAAARGEPVPADGYAGEYVADIARQVLAAHPDALALPEPEARVLFRDESYRLMLAEVRESLARFGVHFDVWFSERSLHSSGAVERALATLREQGHVYEADGATWLRTTDFGDDKDRVLIRSTGETTYLAADAAYYLDKRGRGFDRCIYLLGADHHGYVGRLRSIAACAGDDPDAHLEVLIGQLVSLVKGGKPVRLSKRMGNMVTLDELVDAVGVDAARYSLARSSADTPLTLDLDEITRQTADNPVFYVQYAHARIASLLRNAAELGVERGEDFDPGLLSHEKEQELLKALGQFPQVVATAAELREPHRVARYSEELAGTYHRFYDSCRVLPYADEPVTDLNRTRLWLVEASRIVLANGLSLLGVTAPDRM
jgi:arginyl-tRNA synthetase